MEKFFADLCNPNKIIEQQTYLMEQMKSYIDSSKPFTVSNVQVKFGIGYNRASDLINYFVNNGFIIKNIAGQYMKLHNGLTFNKLQGIS